MFHRLDTSLKFKLRVSLSLNKGDRVGHLPKELNFDGEKDLNLFVLFPANIILTSLQLLWRDDGGAFSDNWFIYSRNY